MNRRAHVIATLMSLITIIPGQLLADIAGDWSRFQVDSTRLLVEMADTIPRDTARDQLSGHESVSEVISEYKLPQNHFVVALNSNIGYADALLSLMQNGLVLDLEPVFVNRAGGELITRPEFIVSFESYVSLSQVDSFATLNSVRMIRPLLAGTNAWLFEGPRESARHVIDHVVALAPLAGVRYAEPNMYVEIIQDSDPYVLWDHYESFQSEIKRITGHFNCDITYPPGQPSLNYNIHLRAS